MKTYWNNTNYGNDLRLTMEDAKSCSHSGQCDDDVNYVMTKPYVVKQLAKLDPKQLRKELFEYTDWDVSDHQTNLLRWVWISAGDIVEEALL
jgi:hypothetical protein